MHRAPQRETSEHEEKQQAYSVFRVTVAVVLVVGLIGAGLFWLRGRIEHSTSALSGPTWFAPYVDTTLTPTYQFQDPGSAPARQIVLGFVVSSSHSPCTPTWGDAYTLDQAGQSLNLDNRIAQVQADGGTVIPSFGGKANSELAVRCTSTLALAEAYLDVIHRYHATTVDFDLEGATLDNWAAIQRRAKALALVEQTIHASGGHVTIWLTLPVATDGLQDNALSVLQSFLHDHVAVQGVNVMTMDFGTPEADMLGTVQTALNATHQQLATLYTRYGIELNGAKLWSHMGATVMIGQNDDNGEMFTVSDAQQLAAFAASAHLGRVSLWSINRDTQCGSAFADIGVHSTTCSGVAQTRLAFTSAFAALSGTANGSTTPVVAAKVNTTDNPATSPYPLWQPADPYPENYLVVREGEIYKAKWYNQGQDPAAQVQYPWQTPWLLIGPVLAGESPPTTTTLPPTAFPAWSPTTAYQQGAEVLFDGLPYQAKWFNTGDSPAAEATDPGGSPWSPQFTVPGEPTAPNGQ